MTRKRRTRQHIIADLSVNYVERFILLAGFSVERIENDYGIDLNLYTYDNSGEIENGTIFIQLKASDNLRNSKNGDYVSFSIRRSDLESWLEELFPVMLVLYDPALDKAYWLYIQRHFESLPSFDLGSIGETYTVRLELGNVLAVDTIKQWASFKQSILFQLGKVVKHV